MRPLLDAADDLPDLIRGILVSADPKLLLVLLLTTDRDRHAVKNRVPWASQHTDDLLEIPRVVFQGDHGYNSALLIALDAAAVRGHAAVDSQSWKDNCPLVHRKEIQNADAVMSQEAPDGSRVRMDSGIRTTTITAAPKILPLNTSWAKHK